MTRRDPDAHLGATEDVVNPPLATLGRVRPLAFRGDIFEVIGCAIENPPPRLSVKPGEVISVGYVGADPRTFAYFRATGVRRVGNTDTIALDPMPHPYDVDRFADDGGPVCGEGEA